MVELLQPQQEGKWDCKKYVYVEKKLKLGQVLGLYFRPMSMCQVVEHVPAKGHYRVDSHYYQ